MSSITKVSRSELLGSTSSLSKIRMVFPILNGNEKKIITPAVILLKIDHCANNATPITAKIEAKSAPKSLKLTLHIRVNMAIVIMVKAIEIYFIIKLVLTLLKSPILPTLRTAFVKINFKTSITPKVISDLKNSSW